MGRRQDMTIYTHRVEWIVYDVAGQQVARDSKLFENKSSAEKYAKAFKQRVPSTQSADVLIRKLDNNQIIVQYKKRKGNINFRRRR